MFERVPDVGGPAWQDPKRCPECYKKHPKKYRLKAGGLRFCTKCTDKLAKRGSKHVALDQ